MVLESYGVAPKLDRAKRSCVYHRDPTRSAHRYPELSPPSSRERAFCPPYLLLLWLAIFFDQIAKKLSKGFPAFLFRKRPGDVARHGIRSSRTHFSMDPGELFLRQRDRNFRG